QAAPDRVANPRPAVFAVPQQGLGSGPANLRSGVAEEFGQRLDQDAILDVGQGTQGRGTDRGLLGAKGHLDDCLGLAGPPALAKVQGCRGSDLDLRSWTVQEWDSGTGVQVQGLAQGLYLGQAAAGVEAGRPLP